MGWQASWIGNLQKFATLDELRNSSFFAEHGEALESYLETPQVFFHENIQPRLRSFLRIAQWNIEKGKNFTRILEKFQNHEILKWADVIVLNEADLGMARSGNRNVARDLAEGLGMHAVFGPAYYELTKGVDDDLTAQGENREGLQGNAILSRYPIIDKCVVPLPVTFEPYEFKEKRFGWRNCLWVRLQLGTSDLWVGAVHLELRNTPQCRCRQMQHILRRLPFSGKAAAILAGDLNGNTFGRGTKWRTAKSVLRLLCSSPEKVKTELLHPEAGCEPLFTAVQQDGFCWAGLNSNDETARSMMDSLEESAHLPDSLLRFIRRRLEAYRGYLCFKLDWMFGKNVQALRGGEIRDRQAGELSTNPGVVNGVNYGPDRISDHLPIYADIDLS